MATDISICSAALTRVAAEPITSFEDGSPASIVAAANYEDVKRAALTNYRWRFATTTALLNRLEGEPYAPWSTAWQVPSGCLLLHGVAEHAGGARVAYDLLSDKILCGDHDALVAEYTWSVPEADWPGHFVELVTLRMAAIFALGLADRAAMAELFESKAEVQMRRCRTADAQTRSAPRIALGRYRMVR